MNRVEFNTEVVGTENTSRTICQTEDNVVVFMCEPNKAYCHQGIQNADRNYPAGRIDMDSIALQEPLPLSRVGYLEIEQKKL